MEAESPKRYNLYYILKEDYERRKLSPGQVRKVRIEFFKKHRSKLNEEKK